jgi:hypothetical protein
VKIEKLTDKECNHLHKCGACFFYYKDGHMVHECPNKPKKNQNEQSGKACTNQPKVQVIEVELDVEEKPPTYKATPSDIYMLICLMTKAKHNKLLEKLIDKRLGDDSETLKNDKDF